MENSRIFCVQGTILGVLLWHIKTIPDAAYYSGWIQTHIFLWMSGWETGNIDQYKD
jgi:hypothetical protein